MSRIMQVSICTLPTMLTQEHCHALVSSVLHLAISRSLQALPVLLTGGNVTFASFSCLSRRVRVPSGLSWRLACLSWHRWRRILHTIMYFACKACGLTMGVSKIKHVYDCAHMMSCAQHLCNFLAIHVHIDHAVDFGKYVHLHQNGRVHACAPLRIWH